MKDTNWMLKAMVWEIEKQELYLCHVAMHVIEDVNHKRHLINAIKHIDQAICSLKKVLEEKPEH